MILKKIPDAYLTPGRTLPQQELADCFITNPKAARLLTYGSRDPRLSDPPHDHGQDGAEVLMDVPVASLTFGPEKTVTGPQVGIQIHRTTALGDNPRILGTAGVSLRAGQTQLSGLVAIAYDALGDIVLNITLRPYSETNRDLGAGLHVTTQVTFTPVAAPEERALAFTMTDLSPLGDSRYDKELELVVWQGYLPPVVVTSGHRLLGVYLDVLAVEARCRDADRSELPRQVISYADIKTGAILGQDLGAKMRDSHNGLLRGMLGRAPGLTNDGRSDRTRPYQQDLDRGHQHEGIDVPDGCGGFWSDGAVQRIPLVALSLCHANGNAGLTTDYAGAQIHDRGIFDSGALRLEARASIPAGLGAMEVRFCLKVGTAQQITRLLIHADVRGLDGVSICTGVSSGVHEQESARDGDGLFVCDVDPLDNSLFTPTRKRQIGQSGLWTLAALRAMTPAPGYRASNQQISETVRFALTHPKLNAGDAPHVTGDYIVILRFELQTPSGATPADPQARLNWVLGLPARGF